MATHDKPARSERVACDVRLEEMPASEAQVAEAADYVAHFCGLDCYEKWKRRAETHAAPAEKPGD